MRDFLRKISPMMSPEGESGGTGGADPYFKAGFNHLGKTYWTAVDELPVVDKYDE